MGMQLVELRREACSATLCRRSGMHQEHNNFLAHERLAIMASGKQFLCNKDRTIWVTVCKRCGYDSRRLLSEILTRIQVNGEIYNHTAMRNRILNEVQ